MIAIWAVAVHLYRAVRQGLAEPAFRGLFYLTGIVIGSGTVFYRVIEDWSWIDSLYFTVISLTTVGYGDLSPTTSFSKLGTVVIILTGIGLLIALIERLAHHMVADYDARRPGTAQE